MSKKDILENLRKAILEYDADGAAVLLELLDQEVALPPVFVLDQVGEHVEVGHVAGVEGIVLEAARVLSHYDSDYTIRFIAFDREEDGLVGSDAYATDHQNDDIRGMISADMVAYDLELYVNRKNLEEKTRWRRFHVGYGDFDLKEQRRLFAILDPARIGIELNPSCIMIPEKSVSGIMALKRSLV